eukprot:scaffold421687_cov51-Prasinocladus_malaysianus.AAC.1
MHHCCVSDVAHKQAQYRVKQKAHCRRLKCKPSTLLQLENWPSSDVIRGLAIDIGLLCVTSGAAEAPLVISNIEAVDSRRRLVVVIVRTLHYRPAI